MRAFAAASVTVRQSAFVGSRAGGRGGAISVVGAALCTHCLDAGWIRRVEGTRAVKVTPKGERNFREIFGIGSA